MAYFTKFCNIFLILQIVFPSSILIPVTAEERLDEFLFQMKLTHWDELGVNTTCPPTLYMTGIRVRYGTHHNISSINGIKIFCSDGIHFGNRTSHVVNMGRLLSNSIWEPPTKCSKGFAVGLTLGLGAGVNNVSLIQKFQIHCSSEITGSENDNSTREGSLSEKFSRSCDAGDALIGFSIKADSVITLEQGETPSVQGVTIECRAVDNPVNNCKLEFGWIQRNGLRCNQTAVLKLAEVAPPNANISETFRMYCLYEAWLGLGENGKLPNAKYAAETFASVGLNNNKDFVKWALLRRLMSNEIKTYFKEKFPDKPRLLDDYVNEMLWADEKRYTDLLAFHVTRYPIPNNIFPDREKITLKLETVYEQFVGNCAIYQMGFPAFRAAPQTYFETEIKKRKTQIVFEGFDQNTTILYNSTSNLNE